MKTDWCIWKSSLLSICSRTGLLHAEHHSQPCTVESTSGYSAQQLHARAALLAPPALLWCRSVPWEQPAGKWWVDLPGPPTTLTQEIKSSSASSGITKYFTHTWGRSGELMSYLAALSWLSSKVALIAVMWNECKTLYINGNFKSQLIVNNC